MSWRRPSNRSSRLALPSGPSNTYSFSTASHGIRRRSAASASRARVNSFSFTSSCWRAASHSCGETIGGSVLSLSFVLLVAILFLLCSLKQTEPEKCSELADADREDSSRGSGCGYHYYGAFDACWAHTSPPNF